MSAREQEVGVSGGRMGGETGVAGTWLAEAGLGAVKRGEQGRGAARSVVAL